MEKQEKSGARSHLRARLGLAPLQREPSRSLLHILPRVEGARVLITGLDPAFASRLSTLLGKAGYRPQLATRISEGAELISKQRFHAVVVAMSDSYGHLVTEVIRNLDISHRPLPVIVLFHRRHPYEGALCYALGASLVMVEPVDPIEVVAAVGALLRLSPPWPLDLPQEEGEGSGEEGEPRLVVKPEWREVMIDGRRVRLTRREYELFSYLLRSSPRVVTRDELLSEVWGFDHSRADSRTVETHIARLRKKLEPDPRNPRYLITLYRQGYRLVI